MNDKNIEERPYLQDLFEHMSNEHGLILTQSEMQEISRICLDERERQTLSSEELSYKAVSKRILAVSYERDRELSDTLTQYKAALSVFIGFLELLNFKEAKVEPEGAANDLFDTLTDAISKAKQLLNNE